ncbi:MAG: aminotransferase class I/II-fold pyridoxal phosphate-dependent enzyme, partial [Nitrosopumilaceae archaeon]
MKLDSTISSHKPVSHGGIYSISDPSPDIVDFSSNINPLGPSPKAVKAIKSNSGILSVYPDSESGKLRNILQKYLNIPESQIVVGNGATEIIYNFCRAFLSSKTKVLIPIPNFGEYEAAAKLSGAKITYFKTMDLEKDIDNFI